MAAASSVGWEVTDGTLRLQGGSSLAAGCAALLVLPGDDQHGVLIFNLIPAFPLDGGRVLRGIVWSVTGNYLTSTRIAGGFGIAFAWLLFVGGFLTAFRGNLLGGVWLFFLGTFLRNAAQSSVAYAQLQELLGGVRVADDDAASAGHRRGTPDPPRGRGPVLPPLPVQGLPGRPGRRVRGDADAGRPARDGPGSVGRRAGRRPGRGSRPAAAVHPREPVLQALRKLAASGQSRLPVVEDGRLVGLLCGRDLLDLMEIRAGLAPPRGGPAVSAQASREHDVLESVR